MPDAAAPALPAWIMPAGLDAIIEDDGEWEDPSWDPLLLTIIGDTRHEGRLIARAWQLTLWPGDPFFASLNKGLKTQGIKPDGPGWAEVLRAGIADSDPRLAARLHDDSEPEACVLWTETEADGRALMEAAWLYLHDLATAR